ncbi:MAG: esterase [Rhodospirillales bacterium]|nr:esterase [Rhodospirillales bacterium]
MIDHLNPDLLKATRLTREGRLTEAMALLQQALRTQPPAGAEGRGAGTQSNPPGAMVIDGSFERILDSDVPPSSSSEAERTSRGDRQPKAPLHARFRMPLRDVLGSLGRTLPGMGSHGLTAPSIPTAEIVPPGGRFIEGSHSNGAGTRAFKLYLPSGYDGQALPLIVMLHGCTQSPDDFAAGTRMNLLAEEQTCLVVYPEQSSAANPSKCWNWFNATDQQRGQGEPALIAGITRQIMSEYAVDARRVYVAGLSAGAAAAAVMAATYPDLYAAAGVHSGLACGAASDLPSAFMVMRQGSAAGTVLSARAPDSGRREMVPTIVFHGDRDSTVHPGNGDQVIARSRVTTAPLTKRSEPGRSAGGLAYTRSTHTDETGRTILEQWVVHGLGHAWSGGSPAGSYTDPRGPDAAREMMRFFLAHENPGSAAR